MPDSIHATTYTTGEPFTLIHCNLMMTANFGHIFELSIFLNLSLN